ncbi:protein-glutamate methylesterase/protein-glutamine glutaminase [Insolitispirillum peregrinum]|uniref:Protein-glutamate methylesterase/protein-glutamine glutaminase n=1 Tax=Insolitispirillum peregrinum TaxID=80876 RepID=A0A1N7K8P4_9PROT|nr:chemotaxis response regulator protein-glutamate methylesterase [Insolitispirillum peregrinum]SIS57959.1 two-component system, chemotaxis family, response regulator CheB [Insolitispirillum peregrinum]
MVVDDSAVVRGLETRMLESDPAIKVVASVGNGQSAIQTLERQDIEIVVLDIEMPVMDGLTALPKILASPSRPKVIMSSTLTQKNAEISLKALELGATDYIPKPSSSRELTGGTDFKRELVEKVKALGAAVRRSSGRRPAPAAPAAAAVPTLRRPGAAVAPAPASSPLAPPGTKVVLRQAGTERPDVICIGSSTGGPQALFTVLSGIMKAGGVTQPILITQHMPATFTTILAEHISRLSGFPAKEAADGDRIEGGKVYVAPGDYHMLVEVKNGEKILRLNQGAPENFCRPSVDPMFRSISQVYGRKVLACVLTGMGSDGARGGKVIVETGGTVIAQDEATSVVWGMPGATAQAGVCAAVLPIQDIAGWIHKFANRRA